MVLTFRQEFRFWVNRSTALPSGETAEMSADKYRPFVKGGWHWEKAYVWLVFNSTFMEKIKCLMTGLSAG